MSASRKSLFSLLREQFTPMVQGTVSHSQVACNMRKWFLTGLCQLHCFYFKFSCKGALCLLHGPFPFCTRSTPSTLPSTSFWVKTTLAKTVSFSYHRVRSFLMQCAGCNGIRFHEAIPAYYSALSSS